MSKKTPLATARKTLFALGIAALLSAAADAADPNTPARKEKAKAPAASLPTRPTSKPKPPALRSPASFTPQTTLGEAIDILRTSTTPPLNIIVLWRPLGDAGVYRDTPIGIDGVAGLRVNRCLELLTLSLSAGVTMASSPGQGNLGVCHLVSA